MTRELFVTAILLYGGARAQTLDAPLTNQDTRAATIAAGSSPALVEFTADPAAGGGDLFQAVVNKAGVAVSLLIPGGLEINESNAESRGYSYTVLTGATLHGSYLPSALAIPGTQTLVKLPPGAPPGRYQIKFDASGAGGDIAVIASYFSSSGLRAGILTNAPSYAVGDTVVLSGLVFDGDRPALNASARVRIGNPQNAALAPVELILEDLGDYDAAPRDGIYSGAFKATVAGNFTAAMRVTGVSTAGAAYSRTVATTFRVQPPLATIVSLRDAGVDGNGDGAIDRVVLDLKLSASTPGNYQAAATLAAATGARITSTALATLANGDNSVALAFSRPDLVALRGNGPFAIRDVLLTYLDDPAIPLADSRPDAGQTEAYVIQAPGPKADVSSEAVDFGPVPVSQTSERVLRLSNSGPADLNVTSISSPDAEITAASPRAPFTLKPAQTADVVLRFTPAEPGPWNSTLTIGSNDAARSWITVALRGSGGGATGAPQIQAGGIANAASFQTPLAPGSLATIFGSNLAGGTASADRLPLPTSLAGTGVTVGGIAAPLIYVSPSQINLQVPFEAPAAGSAPFIVTRDGTPGAAQAAPMAEYAPGIFTYARDATTLDPIVVHADNRLVTPDNPAVANEALIVYATGVALLSNRPASGHPSPASPPAEAKITPTVTVGGAPAEVLFAGLTPGLVGLVQINIKLPSILPLGNVLPLVARFGDAASPAVNLRVAGQAAPTPAISVTPSSLDFGSVAVGQAKDLTLTIRNSGAAALTVNSIASTNVLFTAAIATPFNVAPGLNLAVPVRFLPSIAGAQTGALLIASNDPARPAVQVNVTGDGSGGGAACVNPAPNLVSWWTGDGNALDRTGGNNGALQGSASFATGRVGQAFDFNGSTGHVQIGNPANLRLTAGITIEAWIHPRTVRTASAGPPMAAIVTKWAQNFGDTPDSDSYGLWLIESGGAIRLFSAIHQSGPLEPHIEGGTIPLNTWTHVAMTFDATSGQYALYVNGQSVASLTAPGAIFATNHSVQIGREDSYIIRPFDGLVDETAIFGRALSGAEIRAIYNAGAAGKCK
ncbi:MAG: choice-of-anchor D domain-containing protein [Bryobacteraceae bacterium]|nr:choice-of-anchor D domain-containing protein [Bryobacteraceae bacterium]